MITVDEIKGALPAHLKTAASQDLADKVNAVSTDPETAKFVRDNFISYTSILQEGRFKTEDYVNAVAYVSYKLMGYNNQESYKRTFEQRYLRLVAKGATPKDISAYVSAYNKNILVNKIQIHAVKQKDSCTSPIVQGPQPDMGRALFEVGHRVARENSKVSEALVVPRRQEQPADERELAHLLAHQPLV